jgi:hypothetical protein
MSPVQQTAIGGYQNGVVCKSGDDDESVGGVYVQAHDLDRQHRKVSGQRKLDDSAGNKLFFFARRGCRQLLFATWLFNIAISQNEIALTASRSLARAVCASRRLFFPSDGSHDGMACVSSRIT